MCQAFKASGWAETFTWKLIGPQMAQGCSLFPGQPRQSHAVEKDRAGLDSTLGTVRRGV